MKCIVCGKILQPVWADDEGANQPVDGCEAIITGYYGSDHDQDTFVSVVCDSCVSAACGDGRASVIRQAMRKAISDVARDGVSNKIVF